MFEPSEHLVIHSLGPEAGKGDNGTIQLCQLCTGEGLPILGQYLKELEGTGLSPASPEPTI